MNHQKAYNNLCRSRQILRGCKRKTGYELHHIIPVGLGGSDDQSNLVLFTYREHYVAHWLLTKIYKHEPKMHYGFLCMLRDPHNNRKLTSRMVDVIKKNFSEFKKWHSKTVNPMHSLAARQKHSERMKVSNPISNFPEKNHTVQRTIVYYLDGSMKVFRTKKDFMKTLIGLTHMQKRYRIENNKLEDFGVYKVERISKLGVKI